MTANDLAKWMILAAIDSRSCDPLEFLPENHGMTEREIDLFNIAFSKQIARVTKLLNLKD